MSFIRSVEEMAPESCDGNLMAFLPQNTNYYNIFVLGPPLCGKSSFIKSTFKSKSCLNSGLELDKDYDIPKPLRQYFLNMVTKF
jgi:hypothetical protein